MYNIILRPENYLSPILVFFADFYVFVFYLQGRFTIAAKHHISIAEVYETEIVDVEKVSLKLTWLFVNHNQFKLLNTLWPDVY